MFKHFSPEHQYVLAETAYNNLRQYLQNIQIFFSANEKRIENNGVPKVIIKFIKNELNQESDLTSPFTPLWNSHKFLANDGFKTHFNKFNDEAHKFKKKINAVLVFIKFYSREEIPLSLRKEIGNYYKDDSLQFYYPYLLETKIKNKTAEKCTGVSTTVDVIEYELQKIVLQNDSDLQKIILQKKAKTASSRKLKIESPKLEIVQELLKIMKEKPQTNHDQIAVLQKCLSDVNHDKIIDFFTLKLINNLKKEFNDETSIEIIRLLLHYYQEFHKKDLTTKDSEKITDKHNDSERRIIQGEREKILTIFFNLKKRLVKELTSSEKKQLELLKASHRGSMKNMKEFLNEEKQVSNPSVVANL